MISLPLIAALTENQPGAGDDIVYGTLGVLVVMVTLGAMTLLMYASGWFFQRIGRDAQNKAVRPVAQAIPEPPTGIEPQVVAAIAAAVQATVLAPHRIVTITALPAPGTWSAEGRRLLTTSHKIR